MEDGPSSSALASIVLITGESAQERHCIPVDGLVGKLTQGWCLQRANCLTFIIRTAADGCSGCALHKPRVAIYSRGIACFHHSMLLHDNASENSF